MPSPIHARLAAAVLLLPAAVSWAGPRPVVVELFTSEGCSSCPPAEAYVAELAHRPGVLPLSFHVDYWDDLGWRDRFSLASSTQRQRLYARALPSSVYTPQAVVDGRRDIVGSDRPVLEKSLVAVPDGVPLTVTVDGGSIKVELGAWNPAAGNATASRNAADVVVIGYLREALSPIGRGENSGRTLHEFNIVRSIQTVGSWNGTAGGFQVDAATLPRDVTDVAILVQAAGQGAILGAAALALR